jgi:hypothetical protein
MLLVYFAFMDLEGPNLSSRCIGCASVSGRGWFDNFTNGPSNSLCFGEKVNIRQGGVENPLE